VSLILSCFALQALTPLPCSQAAWAYKAIDTAAMFVLPNSLSSPIPKLTAALSSTRVYILGPSHHLYLDGCALSGCSTYETPIGSLPLDLQRLSPEFDATSLLSR
jgi:predicted class III extradiol MEMO1 family dioxygenase